uniref:Uncharacterized protein n=1 Tax=Opuntia streptacantha TaxID=393608 RepID=A0A7C9AIW6_OPUST
MYARALHSVVSNTLRSVNFPKSFGNSLRLSHPIKRKTCKLCSFVIELGSISSLEFHDRSRYRKCNRLPNVLGNSVIPDQLKSNALRDFQLFSKAPNAIDDSGLVLPTPRYVRILPPVKRLAVP